MAEDVAAAVAEAPAAPAPDVSAAPPEPASQPKSSRARRGKAATAEDGAPPDPTPAQAEGKQLTAKLSTEIDDLWARAEGKTPEPPAAETTEPAVETPAETPAPKPDEKAPEPAPSADEIAERARSEERDRIKREADEREANDKRTREAQEYQQRISRYVGAPEDVAAVTEAIEAANLGDMRLLDALDVMLPNGKRISEVREDGSKGLTAAEAQNLVYAWRQARELGDHVGDRKVAAVLATWDREVVAALNHPDVDAASVTKHEKPADQMTALRESVTERVTQRLTTAHQAEIATKDAEIARQATRIESLVSERGNLASQALAAGSVDVPRSGQGAQLPAGLPTPDELHDLPVEDAFKKGGAIDQIWSRIEGGRPRRRTG